jgi:predicted 3-demethylubiquinone-9 3-methyltransferase (glyoxalase superfamily)
MTSAKVRPFLWYADGAEEAANHYVNVFSTRPRADAGGSPSKVLEVSRYNDAGPLPAGTVMTVEFELDGQPFTALNAGPHHEFTEAISFFVSCESQEEVDHFWTRLPEGGGEEGPCGWLKDRFGVSWQIVPTAMMEMMSDPDPKKAQRVTSAMLQMRKIVIDDLKAAYDSE